MVVLVCVNVVKFQISSLKLLLDWAWLWLGYIIQEMKTYLRFVTVVAGMPVETSCHKVGSYISPNLISQKKAGLVIFVRCPIFTSEAIT